MKHLFLILALGVVLTGCTPREFTIGEGFYDDEICIWENGGANGKNCMYIDELPKIKELESQIDQLKDYLRVVEWNSCDTCTYCNPKGNIGTKEICTMSCFSKTYLTSDPLKVEWVEKECGKFFDEDYMAERNITPHRSSEKFVRCEELKKLIE